jgi:DNA polymerase III delta prime subunit
MLKEEIWIEKYRPKKLDDVVGQVEVIRRLKSYIQARNLPHLLFSGPPGVGKTASAICVARELFGESWANNFTELNASDERGIDVVRNKIKNFARTAPLGEAEFKIIFLDEADSLTSDAQSALRRTMEKYTASCRFILSCNYSSKIIEPIQSRCAVYRFKPISSAAVEEKIRHIASEESIKLFSWDEIPGNDNIKLIEYLKQNFGINWARKEKIDKKSDNKTIKISDENKSISFELKKEQEFLFSWNEIPGNDKFRLTELLAKNFGIYWVKTAEIGKSNDGSTISVSKENNFLSLRLNKEKTKAILKIDDGRTEEFIAKTENGKLNVYEKTKAILTIDNRNTTSESDETDSDLSRINNEKTAATFTGDNKKKKEFIVKTEDGKINIYESINLTDDGLKAIIYVAAGDMRRAINALQAAAMLDRTVDYNAIYKTTSMAKPEEVNELIKIGLKGDFKAARGKLDNLLIEQGLSGEDIIGQIHRAMLDIKLELGLDDRTIVDLIDRIGETDFRMAEGANERIQLEALIAHFSLCGSNKK